MLAALFRLCTAEGLEGVEGVGYGDMSRKRVQGLVFAWVAQLIDKRFLQSPQGCGGCRVKRYVTKGRSRSYICMGCAEVYLGAYRQEISKSPGERRIWDALQERSSLLFRGRVLCSCVSLAYIRKTIDHHKTKS